VSVAADATHARGSSAQDVFIPYSIPELTYVQRGTYEEDLRRALASRGPIISLTGRSKSGKTVLATRVIGSSHACIVGCGTTPGPAAFWVEVLRVLGLPLESTVANSGSVATEHRQVAGVGGGIGSLVHVDGSTEDSATTVHESTASAVYRPSIGSAIAALRASGRTLVVDDFHYLSPSHQRRLGRNLKDAAFAGVPVVILSVPHHGDDPVRRVPDLVGRVQGVRLEPWAASELVEIADKGFSALRRQIPSEVVNRLARESLGSPQIMQLLCLEVCHTKGIEAESAEEIAVPFSSSDGDLVLLRAARAVDFTTLFGALQDGPPSRGRLRTLYPIIDGTTGDVYHLVLRALALDPIETEISYESLKRRVFSLCATEEKPSGVSIVGTVEQLSSIAQERGGAGSTLREPAIEWMAARREVVLSDAYFAFYLRWQPFPRVGSESSPTPAPAQG
jgi:hypothetical protein